MSAPTATESVMRRSNERRSVAARALGFRSPRQYAARCQYLFSGIGLEGKRLIDIGCGDGAFAIWAALSGADSVLGIEPESDGASSGALNKFRQLILDLDLQSTVSARGCILQDLPTPQHLYDVAVLYDVVNHFDEASVQRLHVDEKARDRYVEHLSHVRRVVAPGGTVIVADAAPSNFFPAVGLRAPLAPAIEWQKHQSPEIWSQLFSRAGFVVRDLRWSPVYPFGPLFANRLAQYFIESHFILRLTRNA